MEATGSLWHAVAQAGDAYGYPVDGLNPQRVHTESQTRGRVAQTDTLDAALIAECAWLLRQAGQLARWEPRAAARQMLQPLLRLRTHAKEPLVWQQAAGRALREQGVVAVALTLAESVVRQLGQCSGTGCVGMGTVGCVGRCGVVCGAFVGAVQGDV